MKFDSEIIKEHSKEILIVTLYLLLFGGAIFGFKHFDSAKAKLESKVASAEFEVNSIKYINRTEEELRQEIDVAKSDISVIDEILPINLNSDNVGNMIAEIIGGTGNLFSIRNVEIAQSKDGSNFVVTVKSFNANANDFSNFLDYVNTYKNKVSITALNLTKSGSTLSGSMTLEFYTQSVVEEEV